MNQSKTRKRVGPLIIREVKLTETWLFGCLEFFYFLSTDFKKG